MDTPREVIDTLLKKGWKIASISREIKISQPTLTKVYKNDSTCRFDTFVDLKNLLDAIPPRSKKRGPPVVKYKEALVAILSAKTLDEAQDLADEALHK
jgi:hypothetical protein